MTQREGAQGGLTVSYSVARGGLIVCLLCIVAILPLLRGQTPCTHDGRLHFFRVAAMRAALRERVIFSRWLPNLAFGYGFPFFNYRAPLSYYLTLGLHLASLSLPQALNAVYVLSLIGSALGSYLLARDVFGPGAGVVAGIAYAYAPYQFLDALVRGNAPEAVALALLPAILWAFRRLTLRGGRRWFLVSVLLLAGLYLGHNISSLLFTPFLLAYLGLLAFAHRGRSYWKRAGWAFLLALGLTAFFWVPALLEREYVQLYLTAATRNNDFHHNFVSLAEILSPPAAFDTSLLNPPLRVRLGLIPTGLAALALVTGLAGDAAGIPGRWLTGRGRDGVGDEDVDTQGLSCDPIKAHLLFFAGAAVLFVFMSTPASVRLWEQVPLLPFVQFPWRLVGRASLPVSLLAGAAVPMLTGSWCKTTSIHPRPGWFGTSLLPTLLVAVTILAALPSTYPPRAYCPMASQPIVEDVHRYERRSGLVGVDPVGAYFPVWVEERPSESPLEVEYAGRGTVSRFDASVLPTGAEILSSEHGPNRSQITVESPTGFEARYLSFYFPGWRVWVDGDPVQVFASDVAGLITFRVPQGRHQVTVRFGETPLRLTADVVSILSLIALVATVARRHTASWSVPTHQRMVRPRAVFLVGMGLIVALLPVFKLAVVDRLETPFRRARLREDGTLPHIAHPIGQQYADGLTLIGYERTRGRTLEAFPEAPVLRVDLYWTVRHKPAQRYQTVLHLVGPEGFRWSPKDSYRPTDYEGAPPTSAWQPGQYAVDSHELDPLIGTPPGRYDVVLTVFDRDSLEPLSILNAAEQPAAPQLVIGQIDLGRPRHQPDEGDLRIRYRRGQRMDALMFLGANVSREEAAPGDPVIITTFWRVEEKPERDLVMDIELVGEAGNPAARYARPPAAAGYPTSAWQAGDLWRGQHRVYLPADLETGGYSWIFSISTYRSVLPAQLTVTAPYRVLTRPPVEIEIDASLGDVATLVGADVETGAHPDQTESLSAEPGEGLSVDLVWRAEMTTTVSYRVFVHLVDSASRLVAQSDGVPGEWSRPTTGWIPGEYVTDTHTVAIPSDARDGRYRLEAGLYDPEGGRLATVDGLDFVQVATVNIEGSP